jgi:RNA polymerase sigma-70 factor (ECF subfamily)
MREIDSAVVNAWRRGEELGTHALFEATYPYAVRMGALNGLSIDEARECAQDVFSHAYERRMQLRDPQAFALWFHRILTRGILDKLAKRSRLRETSLDGAGDLAEDWLRNAPLQPDEAAQEAELRRLVWRRVQRLEPRARLAITLRYYSEYSIREVAEALGIREGNARTLLSRALAQLRREHGTDLSGAAPVNALNDRTMVHGAHTPERIEKSHAILNPQ